jgi:hypothetical protein
MKRWTLKTLSKDIDIKFYYKKRWINTWKNKTKNIVKNKRDEKYFCGVYDRLLDMLQLETKFVNII